MTPGGRKVTGETRVPSRSRVSSPASRPSVTQGSGIGSQAGRPAGSGSGGPSARCPAKPDLVRGERDVAQPAGRVLAPREPRDLQDDVEAGRRWSRRSRGAGCSAAGGSAASSASPSTTVRTWSQPSLVEVVSHGAERLQLLGQDAGRAPAGPRSRCAGGTAPAGCRTRPRPPAVPAARACASYARPAYGVETERVDDHGQSAPQPAGDDLVEQREGVRGGVEVVTAAAHDAPAGRRRRRSPPRGSAAAPTSTCPNRTPRPARPGPGQEGPARATMGGVWHGGSTSTGWTAALTRSNVARLCR